MGVVLALVEVDLVVGRVSPFTSDDSPLFSTAFNVVAEVAKANPKSMPNNGDLVVIVVRKVGDSVVVVPVCVNPSVVVPNSLKTGNIANKLL